MADLSNVPWDQFSRRASPDDLVAPNFKFYELTKSELGGRHGIDNSFPNLKVARAAVFLCRNVVDNLEFDQVILECYNAKEGANSGWVHVSRRPPDQGVNRKQVLSYIWNRRSGGYVYVDGLHEST